MENNVQEVKEAIYAGMSIYNTLKNFSMESSGKEVSLEDKKYISLYLGILYSNNEIGRELHERKNIIYRKVKYNKLNKEELLQTYTEGFVDILTQVDFESIFNYFNFLLNNEHVSTINKSYRIEVNQGNKRLVR